MTRITPAHRSSIPVSARAANSTLTAARTAASWRGGRLISIGQIKAETPTISIRLAMLLPTILPTPMSGAPESAASRVTISSGADVPNATTVMPIASDEMDN